jgi:hypothetical protein
VQHAGILDGTSLKTYAGCKFIKKAVYFFIIGYGIAYKVSGNQQRVFYSCYNYRSAIYLIIFLNKGLEPVDCLVGNRNKIFAGEIFFYLFNRVEVAGKFTLPDYLETVFGNRNKL